MSSKASLGRYDATHFNALERFYDSFTVQVWAQNAPRTQLYFYVQEQINDLGIIGYLPPQQLIFDPRSAPLELKPHKKMRRMFEGRNPSRRLRKDKEE